jgi:hypothetical protein
MKMYLIIYDAGFDDELFEVLESSKIKGFTKWIEVMGKGEKSEQKMGDAIWPGFNNAIMIVLEPQEETILIQELNKLYEKMGSMGLRVYNWPVEKII